MDRLDRQIDIKIYIYIDRLIDRYTKIKFFAYLEKFCLNIRKNGRKVVKKWYKSMFESLE